MAVARCVEHGGGRDGAPAWSAAWTAAATSCAVSASMTMFRRSSTRRTTCPACGGASCGPMVAGQGPVASGSVTPGTVEETVLARLLDTPHLQRLLRRSPGGACPVRGSAGDPVANRSIYNTGETPASGSTASAMTGSPLRPDPGRRNPAAETVRCLAPHPRHRPRRTARRLARGPLSNSSRVTRSLPTPLLVDFAPEATGRRT